MHQCANTIIQQYNTT